MIKTIFVYIIPLVLPLTIYLAWAWFRISYVKKHGGEAPKIEQGPWPLLLLLGAILMLALMATTALLRGADSDATYTPPRYEDGRVIPGQLEEK